MILSDMMDCFPHFCVCTGPLPELSPLHFERVQNYRILPTSSLNKISLDLNPRGSQYIRLARIDVLEMAIIHPIPRLYTLRPAVL